MEIENIFNDKFNDKKDALDANFDSQRLKTSLRLRYEAEARILKEQNGKP